MPPQSYESIGRASPIMATSEELQGSLWSELMCSAADSPARTSATPVSVQGSTASGQDYGQSTPELLASYDPATSSWRTSQLCLDWGLSEFSETLPRSGLMRNGIVFRLPPLVPLTAATDSGSWPTPDAMVANLSEDLDNWTACRACKAKYLVDFQRPPETVAVTIQYINDVDWDAFWRAENERR